MPRSRPGPVTSVPSSVIEPSVGSIRPATSRNRLVLPQPEGPTITANSWSATSSEMRSSAVTSFPRLGPNRNTTSSMHSRAMGSGILRPRQQPRAQQLEQLVGDQSEQSDRHDAEED